jgi:hypothetical protein
MRTTNRLLAGGVALALTAGTVAWSANPPLNVNVSNTPLPVSVTNATTNQSVTVTNSASSPVNTTVTNTATNPVPISNGDRPTAFNQTFAVAGANKPAFVPIPAGCRLVIQVVSFSVSDATPTAHLPFIFVEPVSVTGFGFGVYHIPTQQINGNNASFTLGTVAMQIFADSSVVSLGVADGLSGLSNGEFSISGYLLPLTPGASC